MRGEGEGRGVPSWSSDSLASRDLWEVAVCDLIPS